MAKTLTHPLEIAAMSAHIRRVRWITVAISTVLISLITLLPRLFRDIPLSDSLLAWILAEVSAVGIIQYAFGQIELFQTQNENQLKLIHEQAAQQAALIKLSRGFAATQDEAVICQELTKRLHEIQSYDYVAVYTLDPHNNRILRASLADEIVQDPLSLAPGEGLSARPVEDGQLHYTPDVRREPQHVPGLPAGSEIDVPIQYQGDVLGVLIVESLDIDAFDQTDFDLLTAVADQAAIALQYAKLLKLEQERRQTAETMRTATAAIISALDMPEILNQVLIQLKQVVPYDSACIFLKSGDYIHAKAARGLPDPKKVINRFFPADNDLFQLVIQANQPVMIADVRQDARFLGWGGTNQMLSWMGVPLRERGEIIGYLTLDSYQAAAYDAHLADLAQIFADQASVALAHAQLYQSAREAAERMLILHQVSQEVISAGMDPERIYQAIHQAAAHLMPSEAFVISIFDEELQMIRAVYLMDREGRSPEVIVPADEGLSGYVISTGIPVLEFDYLTGEEMQEVNVVHFGSPDHIRAILAVPMRLGSKVFGMLSAQSYRPYDYTTEDQQLLEMLAAYAAIALNNAQLFTQVQRLAITDSLTGTFNRRHFFEVAHRELLRARRYEYPVSVIMLDLDHYKFINDTYGHGTGDLALKLIAQKLRECVRETDVLGRYGGDEFSILLPETSLERAIEIAERLRQQIAEAEFSAQGNLLKTTISLGVSSNDYQCTDINVLMKSADSALYTAKHSGRNQVQSQSCHPSLDA